jgi:protein TonB
VAALHVVVIYALASGLAASVIAKLPTELKAEVVQQKPPEQEKTPPPPPPDLAKPPPPFVPPPDINIQANTGPTTAISNVQSRKPVVRITRPTTRGRRHDCQRGYPPISRRLGEQGKVLLKFTVNADGSVSNVTVAKSSGYSRLDQAAVRCASHWDYHPATQGGKPIAVSYEASVVYRMR